MNRLIDFFRHDIWQISPGDVSPTSYIIYKVLRIVCQAIYFFTTRRIMRAASALTYSTLLAIVPILSVVFAIARGFGYSKYIETWFRDILSSQPQVADVVIGFVNSYLVHARGGVILGFGLLLMLWTVLMLTSNIDQTFNDIWQVKKTRSLFRTFTDYTAMLFLVPIIIVLMSGVSIFMATIYTDLKEIMVIGRLMRFVIDVTPYVLMSVVFIALYLFMPNTKVRFSAALLPGIMAGVAMQVLQLFYIHSQMWVSSYNAIYGSFAALPLFMLWVQISWTICLFGAQLTYANQNLEDYYFFAEPLETWSGGKQEGGRTTYLMKTEELSHHDRLLLCAMLLRLVSQRFERGEEAYTAMELKQQINIHQHGEQFTRLPIHVVNDLLFLLCEVHLLTEVSRDEKGEEPVFQPAEGQANLTIGTLIDRMEAKGKWKLNVDLQQLEGTNIEEALKMRESFLSDLKQLHIN